MFVKEISDRKIVNVQAFISCPEVPSPEKWKLLFENIKPILDKFSSASPVFMHIDNFWVIGLTPLEQRSDYVKERSSYTVIISAPFHKNEHKNLFSKLDEACENLIKHTQTESNSTVNAAFIHLPENASVTQCRIWIEEYFAIQPPKPITAVILFQPTITTNLEKNTSAIHNCFQFIVREEKLSQWNTIGQPIQLTPIVGYVEINSAKNQLIAERDGKKEAVDFDGYYLFQRGNHYLEAQAEEGKMFGIVPKLASGVFVHSHIKIFPDQPSFNISGIYPPVDKLLIV